MIQKIFNKTLIALATLIFLAACNNNISNQHIVDHNSPEYLQSLYDASITDAIVIEPDEIFPVVAITPESDNITWNETQDRVLIYTFHKYPQSYPDGQEITLTFGKIWVTCDKEMQKWYNLNKYGISNNWLRLTQLLGLPLDNGYTHISAMWVSPNDMIRPAYVSDITKSQMLSNFDGTETLEFYTWFNDNIISSYFEGTYPWTRLGYTYDWAENGIDYGLSEFLVNQNSKVEVYFTKDVDTFFKDLGNIN